MASHKNIPFVQIKSLYDAGKSADERRRKQLSIAIFIDKNVDNDLIQALKLAFMPELSSVYLRIFNLEEKEIESFEAKTFSLVLLALKQKEALAAQLCQKLTRESVPCAVICRKKEQAPFEALDEDEHRRIQTFAASDTKLLLNQLAQWLLAELPNLSLALATNFSFIRKVKLNQLIDACAKQNALVGAIQLIPGADFPVMTINQLRMAVDIAAICGFDLSRKRLPEIIAIIANGLIFRGIARSALGFIPIFGWALKGALAWTGTVAVGRALQARFDRKAKV